MLTKRIMTMSININHNTKLFSNDNTITICWPAEPGGSIQRAGIWSWGPCPFFHSLSASFCSVADGELYTPPACGKFLLTDSPVLIIVCFLLWPMASVRVQHCIIFVLSYTDQSCLLIYSCGLRALIMSHLGLLMISFTRVEWLHSIHL